MKNKMIFKSKKTEGLILRTMSMYLEFKPAITPAISALLLMLFAYKITDSHKIAFLVGIPVGIVLCSYSFWKSVVSRRTLCQCFLAVFERWQKEYGIEPPSSETSENFYSALKSLSENPDIPEIDRKFASILTNPLVLLKVMS